MGFNTTVFFLNDLFDQVQKDPERFVEIISQGMHDGADTGIGCYANGIQVMPTAHADVPRLYHSHGNAMLDLSRFSRHTMSLATSHHDFQRDYVDRTIEDAERQLADLKAEIATRRLALGIQDVD